MVAHILQKFEVTRTSNHYCLKEKRETKSRKDKTLLIGGHATIMVGDSCEDGIKTY